MPSDTESAAQSAQLAALRKLGPSERVRLAAEMSEDARAIAVDGERRRHPELSEDEARRAVMLRQWRSTPMAAVGSGRD